MDKQNTDDFAAPVDRLIRHFVSSDRPLIAIEWVDSFGCPPGWEFEDEVEPTITTVKTVGFLMRENDHFVLVAPHVSTASDRRQLAGHMAIPKQQIVQSVVVTSFSCPDAD
ncbi:MAG: hypothetical protein KDA90_19490 [Planctomycetaceae bacterium]|nr:hypothetical protein [Planctomycetaceae bacterium]